MKVIGLLLLLLASNAFAHKPSDSYLRLTPAAHGFTGEWRIALRDLDTALHLDTDEDRAITWGEVRTRHVEIADYALSRLRITALGASCPISAGDHRIEKLSDGTYTVMSLTASCPGPVTQWTLDYDLLFDIDPTHRGIVTIDNDRHLQTFVLSPKTQQMTLSPTAPSGASQFARMLEQGVHHIWTGFDHLLFLAALLLPVGLRASREPSRSFRPLFKEVLWLVSAFTVAHSITLSLAALRIASVPPRWIETAIAVSVVVAGLRVHRSHARGATWIAFGFGLIHGFGFANVLFDMQLPQSALAVHLLAFNLGVEVGQCAVVAAVLPLLWYAQRFNVYRRVLIPLAGTLIAVVGATWTIERSMEVSVVAIVAAFR
jgi:hypothetical protein